MNKTFKAKSGGQNSGRRKSNSGDGGKPGADVKNDRRKNSKPRNKGSVRIVVDGDRMAAYKALLRIDKSKAYSNIELNAILSERSVDVVVNPAFVREIVYGVIKNKRYLDYFINDLARDGIEGVRREIVILLRMGLYQILFMDSVPDHSAVDETVKITKLLFPGRDGFVNGLLRSFIRKRDTVYGKPDELDASDSDDSIKSVFDSNTADSIDIRSDCFINRYIEIPISDPIRRMSVMYSCDEGSVRLLAEQHGILCTERILRISLGTPPLFVRVNTLKISAEALADLLKAQGFSAEIYASDRSDTLIVSGHGILETKEFDDGLFFVQDMSSTEAIAEFDPKAGEVLIDVCAAPGGKTFSAAIQMQDRGVIHAMDLHGNKLRALEKQSKRLGISIIDTEEHDAKNVNEKYAARADKVLCDVPCSGLGVLRRKPEIKDRPLMNDGRDLAEIQYRILSASAEYVKPGGELMYSTCTINKIENEDVTDRFVSEHGEFTVRHSKLTLPCTGGPDGFYYCIMHRK